VGSTQQVVPVPIKTSPKKKKEKEAKKGKSLSANKEKTIWHQICGRTLNFRYVGHIRASFILFDLLVCLEAVVGVLYYYLSLSLCFFF